ncbi:hypothetical protein Tco_0226012 [Tanacetum coccineum]
MAFSDSEVYTDKTCSKTCLQNYETLKKQCDDLIVKLNQTEFIAATYKRGLATVEAQLITYRKNEVLFSEEVAVLKREVACKDYKINVLKSECEKVKQEKDGIEFKIEKFDKASKVLDQPNKLDLSYSGLDEFKEPEFKGYGPENSEQESNVICDKKSDNSKENSEESLVEEQVSQEISSFVESSPNVDKETVFPVNKKVEFIKPKNHEKPVKKSVRYAEIYRSQSPRGNQRNWNNQKSQQLRNDFVMHNKAWYVCGSFDHLQYTCKQKRQLNGQREEKPVWNNARKVNHQNSPRITHLNPKRHMVPRKILTRSGLISLNTARQSHFNAFRTNQVNAVKASSCWVWRPIKSKSASITLKRYDYVDGNPETELEDSVGLNSPEDKKRAGAELTQENDKSQYKKCLDTSS